MSTLELLRERYDTCAITFADVCREIGIAYNTGANQLALKQFPVPTYLQGRHRFTHIRDLANYLESKRVDAVGPEIKRRRGRPTNAERVRRGELSA